MTDYHIHEHPIIKIERKDKVPFFWQDKPLMGYQGDTIASALIANGIHIFGYHPKDHAPLGIFCANGQCAQCLVIADGLSVKACITEIKPQMKILPMKDLASLPTTKLNMNSHAPIKEISIPVLIIGGGPAGLSAALELGRAGILTILIDDKWKLGGKLILQTHRFFGSRNAVYAGSRGIEIAQLLQDEIYSMPQIDVWLKSTALAVYSDKKVGILRNDDQYVLVNPEHLLIACGAREKNLSFPGNTLPGIIGAGAFQTLVNRDLVIPAQKLLIIGGGNVGLIAGYHAIQAGIQVVGLIEAQTHCSGYKVHEDKLRRLGVPIFTSHTILGANGTDHVESVDAIKVHKDFQPIPETRKTFICDCVLIAIGLDPINELYKKAQEFGIQTTTAGDAEQITEASAAIYSGKIRGREIAARIKSQSLKIPSHWYDEKEILASKPGAIKNEHHPQKRSGVYPVFHCTQLIPCDPCAYLCPLNLIHIDNHDIRNLPFFRESTRGCSSCLNCVAGCPGLAITLVDYRTDSGYAIVSLPFELNHNLVNMGDDIILSDSQSESLGKAKIFSIIDKKAFNSTKVLQVKVPKEIAELVAGYSIQEPSPFIVNNTAYHNFSDDAIICRCERVTAGEIRDLIHKGYRDLNEIKTITRAGMGACGGKTCQPLISQLFIQEGIPPGDIIPQTNRPLFIEVPLIKFAGTHTHYKK